MFKEGTPSTAFLITEHSTPCFASTLPGAVCLVLHFFRFLHRYLLHCPIILGPCVINNTFLCWQSTPHIAFFSIRNGALFTLIPFWELQRKATTPLSARYSTLCTALNSLSRTTFLSASNVQHSLLHGIAPVTCSITLTETPIWNVQNPSFRDDKLHMSLFLSWYCHTQHQHLLLKVSSATINSITIYTL